MPRVFEVSWVLEGSRHKEKVEKRPYVASPFLLGQNLRKTSGLHAVHSIFNCKLKVGRLLGSEAKN